MAKPELVVDAHALVGEGPHWDKGQNILYWIDIKGKKLHCFNPETAVDRQVALAKMPGAVVARRKRRPGEAALVAAMEDGFYALDAESGSISPLSLPESSLPGNRFNDGKCDTRGRFWAGTMENAESGQAAGSLYSLSPDGSCTRHFGSVGISNGLAWSPDNSLFYYIDTPRRGVDVFDFDAEAGTLQNRRRAFDIPSDMGFPDGMTIDAEGMLWVALWGGWGIGRWDPRSGKLLYKLELPVARVSCCTFGGPKLSTLYITTASLGIEASEAAQPHAGGLFAWESEIQGSDSMPFGAS